MILISFLTNETDVLSQSWKMKPSYVSIFCNVLSNQQMMMPNIIKVLKLLLVNSATSPTSERSFSLARPLKAGMLSTIFSRRLNALTILHEHKTFKDEFN